MLSTFRLVAVASMALMLGATASMAAPVYSNDFSVDAAGFTGANAIQTAPDGTKFLGFLTTGAQADLSLSGLGAHTSVTLSFDLYALRSMDGSGSHGFGPDYFTLKVNNSTVLLNDTFSSGWAGGGAPFQSYGGPGLSGSYAGTTGSASFDPTAFGYGCYFGCENTYNLSFTFLDSASSIAFNFFGNTTQGWDDEGFGIDNVVVTTRGTPTSRVPEPLTFSLFGAGLAGVAAMRRRKKAKQA
ncbi:MAG TPA: PEP-CTERM sorting domain-containing protein [Rhizomicrobium sp.]|nr:PEP-CTERM sorting domain-containing protein [Rhizomicrobium sp.]